MTRTFFALTFLAGFVAAVYVAGRWGERALDRVEREWPEWIG